MKPEPSPHRRPAWLPVVLALLTVVAAGVLVFRPRPTPPAPLPKATRATLVLREGRLHFTNDAAPFAGWLVEHYSDGGLRSRSMLSSGVLNGLSEGWTRTGVLEVRETYVEGVCHGLRTRWHTNGVVRSQTTFVAGRPEGVFRRWHANGALAEQVEFRAGQENGTSLALYPSGHLKAEATVAEGKLVGSRSWPDGAMAAAPELASTAPVQP